MRPRALSTLFLLLALLVAPLLGACGSGGGSPPPPEDLRAAGPYAVGFEMLSLVDASRPTTDAGFTHRPVPVYVWYPVDPGTVRPGAPEATYAHDPYHGQGPVTSSSDWERHGVERAWQEAPPSARGPFPVVVYSHGMGRPSFDVALGARLASHGFVFASVLHLGEWPTSAGDPAPHSVRRILFDRPRDVSFALTDLLVRNETPGDLLHGSMREDAVAAAGFSVGGYTTMTLAAGDDDVCDVPDIPMNRYLEPVQPGDPCVPTPADPRIRAIVPMDGSNQFLHVAELKRVTVPSLGLGRDWASLASQGVSMESWQARQHALFTGRPAVRVNVLNTNHEAYENACAQYAVLLDIVTGGDQEAIRAAMRTTCDGFTAWTEVRDVMGEYTIAFLRTVLTGEPGYAEVLTPAWTLANEPWVQLFVQERVPASEITAEWPDDATYFRHMSEVP